MKKYIDNLIQKGKKTFRIFKRYKPRNWGLAQRLEHRRIKGNQKKKEPKKR